MNFRRKTRHYESGPALSRLIYANILGVLAKTALVLIVAAFPIYISDLLPGGSTAQTVAQHWHLSADEYAESMGRPAGWARLSPLMSGESISMITLLFLGFISIICLIRITPVFVSERDWTYTVLAITEAVVLVVAASGILA